jgi:hypothetical protein
MLGKAFRAFGLRYSRRARAKRAVLFNRLLQPAAHDLILDLGSEDGSHIASVVPFRDNVVIADIDEGALQRGAERYGFRTLRLDESGRIPAADGEFDIVFCSSVIEHVTVDKGETSEYRSKHDFERAAWQRQQHFAGEIRRIAKRYYVQTPNRYFLIESHTWLPGIVAFLPRPLLIQLIAVLNRWWPKKTFADFNLLTARQMAALFPDGQLIRERSLGMTKSLVVVRTDGSIGS